MQAELM